VPNAPSAPGSEIPKVGRVVPPCEKGAFCYTTTVAIHASPEKVVAALNADWNAWWAGGSVTNNNFLQGTHTFDLAPIALGPVKPINVHVTVQPLVKNPNGSWSLPTSLLGNFEGKCGFTIWRALDGTTILQSSWYNMKPHGAAALLGGMAIKAHWLAEDNALNNLNNYLTGKPTTTISVQEAVKMFLN